MVRPFTFCQHHSLHMVKVILQTDKVIHILFSSFVRHCTVILPTVIHIPFSSFVGHCKVILQTDKVIHILFSSFVGLCTVILPTDKVIHILFSSFMGHCKVVLPTPNVIHILLASFMGHGQDMLTPIPPHVFRPFTLCYTDYGNLPWHLISFILWWRNSHSHFMAERIHLTCLHCNAGQFFSLEEYYMIDLTWWKTISTYYEQPQKYNCI